MTTRALLLTTLVCGLASSGIAQASDPPLTAADSVLVHGWQAQLQALESAKTAADSTSAIDSLLVTGSTVLHRNELRKFWPWNLILRTKLLKLRGDSAGEWQALRMLWDAVGSTPTSIFDLTDGIENAVGPQDAWAFYVAQGVVAPPTGDSQSRHHPAAGALRQTVYRTRWRTGPQTPEFLRRTLASVTEDRDWPQIVAVSRALEPVDSTTRTDPGYYATLITAYLALQQPAQVPAVVRRFGTYFTPATGEAWRAYLREGRASAADALLRQELARRYPGRADVMAMLFAQASRAHAWAKMITYGRQLPEEACGQPRGSAPAGGQDTLSPTQRLMALAQERVPCAQLLTAYLATNHPAQVDATVAQITARFRFHHESALQRWYTNQLLVWGGDEAGGLNLISSIVQRNPQAAAMHGGLLRHAIRQLARGALAPRVPSPEIWPSEPPAGMPFARSRTITGIEFSGVYANYGGADTWYPTWGADDLLYSPYTDGGVDDIGSNSSRTNTGSRDSVTTGRAVIRGDDPLHLTVTALPAVSAPAAPYDGRYPAASLMSHGVWYVGTYTLDDLNAPPCEDYCVLGPFVGFHWSTDQGRTWHAPPREITPAHPLFGETAKDSARVKLSAAHFVDFGKDMQYSPDGKAYLIGHGATAPHSHNGWIAGDQIYLARVTPSPETINDVQAWEFYAGKDASGKPRWSKHFSDIRPLLEWRDHLGNVAVTYDAPLKKFLLFTTHGWPSIGPFDTIVLEADQLTGPWRLVTYMKDFGPQAYFVNMPSKFISKDGSTMWLCYSANFGDFLGEFTPTYGSDPPGGGYNMVLHKIRLLGPTSSVLPRQ